MDMLIKLTNKEAHHSVFAVPAICHSKNTCKVTILNHTFSVRVIEEISVETLFFPGEDRRLVMGTKSPEGSNAHYKQGPSVHKERTPEESSSFNGGPQDRMIGTTIGGEGAGEDSCRSPTLPAKRSLDKGHIGGSKGQDLERDCDKEADRTTEKDREEIESAFLTGNSAALMATREGADCTLA
ncbi:hypothetical protein Ancab_007973 [Ancistrocladus abbreviatus]